MRNLEWNVDTLRNSECLPCPFYHLQLATNMLFFLLLVWSESIKRYQTRRPNLSWGLHIFKHDLYIMRKNSGRQPSLNNLTECWVAWFTSMRIDNSLCHAWLCTNNPVAELRFISSRISSQMITSLHTTQFRELPILNFTLRRHLRPTRLCHQ